MSLRRSSAGAEASTPTTVAPAPASRRTVAAPMNPPAPVTATRLPSKSPAPTICDPDSYTRPPCLVSAPRAAPHPRCVARSRVAAGATLAAAFVLPVLRRRRPVPATATLAALVGGPMAIAVLRSRTRGRDIAIYTVQMWGFVMAHELPYDDPEALRRRLRIRYPIATDRALGLRDAAHAPPAARAAAPRPRDRARQAAVDRPLVLVLRAARLAAVRAGAPSRALPDAPRGRSPPPTTSAAPSTSRSRPRRHGGRAEEGYIDEDVHRIMVAAGGASSGAAWGAALRRVQRQPMGGDAVPSFRDLGDGGDPPGRGGAPARRARAGATRRPSASPSSTWASTT